jgi:RNA polymerase sigma-70 factor, ECF subfamily
VPEDQILIAAILSAPSGAARGAQVKHQAFAQLVTKYQALVLSVIFAMIKNDETARDLTQETFLKAFRALGTFDSARSFKAWLLKIANNTVVDHLRAIKNKEELSLELLIEEDPGQEPHAKNDPSEIAEHNLFLEKLGLALQLLPLRYRQAFVLRYQFDLAYDEIAEVMQENESTVKTLLFRSRDRLRKILSETPQTKTEKNHE